MDARAAGAQTTPPVLRVAGTGEVRAKPDQAVADFAVETRAATAREAGAGASGEAGAAPGRVAALRRVAARHAAGEHQVRLAWTLHQGPHVLAIPGTGNLVHLEQNIAAGAVRLSPADLAEIDRFLPEQSASVA